MFTVNGTNGIHKGWQQPMMTVRPERVDNNIAAAEPKNP